MNDYWKDELLHLIESWPPIQLDNYILSLEERIKHTKEQIKELRALKKRKLRDTKDTGTRGGGG